MSEQQANQPPGQPENQQPNVWDKIKEFKATPYRDMTPEQQEKAREFLMNHTSEELPPEIRQFFDNPNPSDSEDLQDVRQRLAMYQDIQDPNRAPKEKSKESETRPETLDMTIAPKNPPNSETLPGVKERLRQNQTSD